MTHRGEELRLTIGEAPALYAGIFHSRAVHSLQYVELIIMLDEGSSRYPDLDRMTAGIFQQITFNMQSCAGCKTTKKKIAGRSTSDPPSK
jgi:hypothetical protein